MYEYRWRLTRLHQPSRLLSCIIDCLVCIDRLLYFANHRPPPKNNKNNLACFLFLYCHSRTSSNLIAVPILSTDPKKMTTISTAITTTNNFKSSSSVQSKRHTAASVTLGQKGQSDPNEARHWTQNFGLGSKKYEASKINVVFGKSHVFVSKFKRQKLTYFL